MEKALAIVGVTKSLSLVSVQLLKYWHQVEAEYVSARLGTVYISGSQHIIYSHPFVGDRVQTSEAPSACHMMTGHVRTSVRQSEGKF